MRKTNAGRDLGWRVRARGQQQERSLFGEKEAIKINVTFLNGNVDCKTPPAIY